VRLVRFLSRPAAKDEVCPRRATSKIAKSHTYRTTSEGKLAPLESRTLGPNIPTDALAKSPPVGGVDDQAAHTKRLHSFPRVHRTLRLERLFIGTTKFCRAC
jgi:hypothetical protein